MKQKCGNLLGPLTSGYSWTQGQLGLGFKWYQESLHVLMDSAFVWRKLHLVCFYCRVTFSPLCGSWLPTVFKSLRISIPKLSMKKIIGRDLGWPGLDHMMTHGPTCGQRTGVLGSEIPFSERRKWHPTQINIISRKKWVITQYLIID